MKTNILIAFGLIFALFALGTGITVHQLIVITTDLRNLLNLHEIADIRQQLNSSIQKVQRYTFASTVDFAKHLDEIIENASVMEQTVGRCHGCHHAPSIQAELNATDKLIGDYEEKLSRLITFVGSAEGTRRQDLQGEVIILSNMTLAKVQDMIGRASNTITAKTSEAMQELNHSYIALSTLVIFTFAASLFIASSLRRRLVRPIDELLTATGKIAMGEFGYTTKYKETSEFGILFDNFNAMSLSIANKEQQIRDNLERLNILNRITLPLHAIREVAEVLDYLGAGISNLMGIAEIGIMTLPEADDDFILNIRKTKVTPDAVDSVRISQEEARRTFLSHKGRPMRCDGDGEAKWPFSAKPTSVELKTFCLHWLARDDELSGAVVCINKLDGVFLDDDLDILGILATNISVALDNIGLYKNIQIKMYELQQTQRQLIETEKLTALGTLAGGIAHDFNNILSGMTGYISLLKRSTAADTRDYQRLQVLENAILRAAALVRQLLTFARQGILRLRPVDLNQSVMNVVNLLQNTFIESIDIKLSLEDPLPFVQGDPAQVEQIVMNLCVNARDAMPSGGDLFIKTEEVLLDKRLCVKFADAKPGKYVKLTVEDRGMGIDKTLLPRIFEPFFTTKEIGKGTGLGLSIVYGIVRSHGGFCTVDNAPEKGAIFAVYLPIEQGKASPL